MAVMTRVLIIASLLLVLSLHLLHVVQADDQLESTNAQNTLPKTIDCGSACATRCQLSKRPRLCKRACGSCCFRCQCVPPGTSGNTDVCPCYATMTTHGNRLKCP
ncbi:gibberellin-regulated protein 1-like [Macadamia integrifolia]|uniref:gibberellin-regulated protein 1-like n=1 Tax=Macadamia integrifolia TaxID=60698 RepID=UPI001C4E9679|nr:gibberellin-regulated protein 1-like [Macadamia integrifolia]